MRELTENFVDEADLDQTLGRVTAAAVELIDGVDYADVLLIDDGRFRSVAPTDPIVSDLDELQMRTEQGPCLAAAEDDTAIRSPDLEQDSRWPAFSSAAVAAGVRSLVSFQLFVQRGPSGALNLLSRSPHAIDSEGEALGALLATHAAIAIMAANKHQQYRSAIASRDEIGQAKGILMKEFSIDAVRAFELMVRLSQDSNTPVRAIARRVIDSL